MKKTNRTSSSSTARFLRENGSTVLVILGAAALLYFLAQDGPHPLNGQPAPEFSLPSLAGETVTLSSHTGADVVVLDFWASWCPPCRKGLPVLDAVAKRFADQSVAVYAINIREGEGLVGQFVKDMGLGVPVLLDDTGIVAEDYGVSGIPQTVIIGKDGMVQAVHVGVPIIGFENDLVEGIQAALAPAEEEAKAGV